MPVLFVFLLKVNVALLAFCAGYFMVLRRLTFYTLNRIYLVTAILFASVYPQVNLSAFMQQHQQIAQPVQAVIVKLQVPVATFINPLAKTDYWQWAELIFWAGAILFATRLIVQLFSLLKIYSNSTAARIYNYKVRVIKGDSGPFSFWKSIYVNPERHEAGELRSILMHEQVHVNEWHTLDILLAELSTVFYWFNPGVWLIKKAIRENIEFITDRKILKTGADSRQYQYSLLNVSFSAAPQGIVNHFNISTIKKRIIMMNAKRSSKAKLTRYALLIPGVVILLLVFSISKAELAKKGFNKALTASLKTTGVSFVKANTAAVVSEIAGKPAAAAPTDTIKKGNIYIKTAHHSDSLNYIINGVKASKSDFDALASDRIYSIEIMPASEAGKVFGQIDNKNDVLFVTTDDSTTGKKFKEKMDKLNSAATTNGNSISIGRGSSTAGYVADGDGVTVVSPWIDNNASGVSASAASGVGSGSVSINLAPRAYTLKSMPGKIKFLTDSAYKNGKPVVVQLSGPDSGMVYTTYTSKNLTYTISPKPGTYTFKNKVFKYNTSKSPKAYTVMAFNNADANIEHLSAKLIVIDGREANRRDLKKLSAADIESMSVKSGDEMTDKYGDKAKNGVLFITTTKDKHK